MHPIYPSYVSGPLQPAPASPPSPATQHVTLSPTMHCPAKSRQTSLISPNKYLSPFTHLSPRPSTLAPHITRVSPACQLSPPPPRSFYLRPQCERNKA